MLVVLSAYPKRVETNRHLWGEYTVFNPGLVGKRVAHLVLARWAVEHSWDESVHVIQDDVTTTSKGTHHGEITSYHPSYEPGHVCPRSFTATENGWRTLVEVWGREGRACTLWTPDYVYENGRV